MTLLPTKLEPRLIPAGIADYPIIQNLARFYVYDMARYCGFISDDWACPSDGLYEAYDFKIYFEEATRKPYLIKVEKEIAGFVLLNQIGTSSDTQWNMGEFFILSKFQRSGIGRVVAEEVWNIHPGIWEVSVIPENTPALAFWRSAVSTFTKGNYTEEVKVIDYDTHQAARYILCFDTKATASVPVRSNASTITINFVDEISEELEKRMTAGFEKII